MSSGVIAGGIIAASVMMPVAVAFGAGWVAWQSGKLLIEANRVVDRQIEEKKRQLEEEARLRRIAAISAHSQLVDMCSQILSQLESNQILGSLTEFAEIEQIKYDLTAICKEELPEDVSRIESLTSLGYNKLDKAIRRQREIASITLSDTNVSLYQGLSVADLMDDLRIAVGAMNVHATKGADVVAAEPDVLERVQLNKQFAKVTSEIMSALESIEHLSSTYGLSLSGNAWFSSCFNGIDEQIEQLCKPNTTNAELKKGIKRLQESVEQYNLLAPSIEKELKRKSTLYKIYVDASKALGETVLSIKAFKDSSEIEERMKYLENRAEKAKECAEIYRKLGPTAYLCYAWDQELKAIGYEVYARKKILEMANMKPEHAELGKAKLPFYQWSDDDLTQLYSLGSQCALQIIVHDDGTVSMQTIADSNNEDVIKIQHKHCDQLSALCERLKENWFILYDYTETDSPNEITTVSKWRMADDNAWRSREEVMIEDQREKEKNSEKTRRLN